MKRRRFWGSAGYVFVVLLVAASILVAQDQNEAAAADRSGTTVKLDHEDPAGNKPFEHLETSARALTGETWDGNWSQYSYHIVPWQCRIAPATLTYVETVSTVPFIQVTRTVTTQTSTAASPTRGSCSAQGIDTGRIDQVLAQSYGSAIRYTACVKEGPASRSGCGHAFSNSTSHDSADMGILCATAVPPSELWINCRANARRWVYMGHTSAHHQTWRYVYCGTDDTQNNLLNDLRTIAPITRDPDTGKSWAGQSHGLSVPPSAASYAQDADPQPHVSASKTSNHDDCWETDILTVEIGDDISVDEGDPAVLDVTLNRASATGSSPCVEVRWRTYNGSAHSGADYAGTAGMTHTFTAGAITGAGSLTQQLASISTVADSVTEGDEQFKVKIISASLCPGATGSAPTVIRHQAIVTILDTPANRQVSISPTLVTVTEGDPGDNVVVPFTISHDGNPGDVTSVRWKRINRSAHRSTTTTSNDNDYVRLQYSTELLTFPPGSTSIIANIEIVEDTVCEPTQTLEVELLGPLPAATTSVAVGTATVTIIDDDCVPVEVRVGPDISIDEGTGGPPTVATVHVSHNGSAGDVASVLYHVVAETATLGTDFTGVAPSGARAIIPATATSTPINVDVDPDSLCEQDETFHVKISHPEPTGSAITIVVDEARVRIIDDDCVSLRLRVGPDISIIEGTGGPPTVATVNVSHNGSAGAVASVLYRLVGVTATVGTDFTGVAPSGVRANIPATATSTAISVDIDPDSVCEPDETFRVDISNVLPPGSATIAVAEAWVRIIDDDCPLTTVKIKVDPDTVQVDEFDPVATLTITHDGSPGDVQSVRYRLFDDSAAAGSDYTTVASSGVIVSFGSATSVTVDVPIINDTVCELAESFRMEADNPVAGSGVTAAVTSPTGRVRIIDDDCTLVKIKVDPDTVQVNEPDSFATLTITHDGSPGDVQSVRYRLFDASATAGTDYTTVPSSGIIVNFAGATSVDVDVPIIDDAACEGAETFTMAVDNPVAMPSVTATVSSPTGRVRILDNEDCVPVIISMCDESQPAGVHSEGTPIGTHPSRGSCPVPYSWTPWPGARTAGRGSPPPRGACVGAFAGHDAWNVIAGQTNTLDIFANDRLSGFSPSVLISPQEGRVTLSGAGAAYVSSAWAHGSDEFIYQIRYGTGSNDFCNARVQITVLDTGPVTLGTGVVFLSPEKGGFEAANWKPSVQTYNDDGADINPHEVQTTHRLWTETRWTCRRRSSVNVGDPDYNGHTIPSGTPFFGGQTRHTGAFSVTYYEGWGSTSGRRQTTDFNWQEPSSYNHAHLAVNTHGDSHPSGLMDGDSHSHSYTYTAWANIRTVNAVQNAPTSRPAAYSDSTTSLTGPYPCPTVNHNGSSVGGSYVGIAWDPIIANAASIGDAGVKDDPSDDLTEVYTGATLTVEPVPVEFKHYSGLRWMDPQSLALFWHTWESVTFPVDDSLPVRPDSWVRDADGDVDGATVVLDTTSVRYFDPAKAWLERAPSNWPFLICDARAVSIRLNSTGCHHSTGYITGSDIEEKMQGMLSGQMLPNGEIQQSAWNQTDLTQPLGVERNPIDYRFYESYAPGNRNNITGSADCHGRTETPPVPTPVPDNLSKAKHGHPSDHEQGSAIPMSIGEPAHVPSMDSFRVRDEHEWLRRLYGSDATRIHDHFHGLNPATFRAWHCDPLNGVPEIPRSQDWDEEWRWSYNQYNRASNVLDEFQRRPILQDTNTWSPYHTSVHWITRPGSGPSDGGSAPLFTFNYVVCDSRFSAWKAAGYPSGFIPWNTSETAATATYRLVQNNITNYCTLLTVEFHYTPNAGTNGLLRCRNTLGVISATCSGGNIISAS